jgi:gas vesicle protein
LTNDKHSIFSYEGKSLLKQYIKDYQTGGSGLPTIKDVYGNTAIPLPPPVLKRNNSLDTLLRQSAEMRDKQLKRDVEKLRKSKQTKSKKTQKTQKTQKEKICKGLKYQMEQAQNEYYTKCDKETIKQTQQEIQDANKGISDFTNLGK